MQFFHFKIMLHIYKKSCIQNEILTNSELGQDFQTKIKLCRPKKHG
jgi:hypothetical protein